MTYLHFKLKSQAGRINPLFPGIDGLLILDMLSVFISMNFLAICHIFRICSLQEVLNVHCVNGSLHGVEWLSCQQL